MKQWSNLLLATACLSLVLSGCSGTGETRDDAAVEEAGSGGNGTAALSGSTQTQGYGGTEEFSGHPLDDPASPLSQRVVYFSYDSIEIRSEDRPVLEAHAAYLADHPEANVVLEGHADERGTREYNLALGESRAASTRRLMALLGASEQQLRQVSYGEERPAVIGQDESSWQMNRRVELDYTTR